jgi:acyl carrier protein
MADINAETLRGLLVQVAPDTDMTGLEDDTLFDDIDLDSIDFFNLLLEVQVHCGIEIPDQDLDRCNSINNIIGYCSEK